MLVTKSCCIQTVNYGVLKGVLHLLPNITIFCDLSQNNQHLKKKKKKKAYASYGKLFMEVKNGIEILVGLAVFKFYI